MQKVLGHVAAVLKGILFTGISLQILLGLVWLCCNFSNVPPFGESLFLLRLSETLRCDEYTGILYPLFLKLVCRNHYLVYAVQLAVAYVAGRRFLQILRPTGKAMAAWGSLALLTIPMALQCHLAVLPCSFAASLLLFQLSFLLEMSGTAEKRTLKQFAALSACWLLLSLLLPEYLFLGAVAVLSAFFVCLREWKGQYRKAGYGLLLLGAFLGMILAVDSLTQTVGLYGKAQKSPVLALTGRMAWTNLRRDAEEWPEELENLVEEGILLDSSFYPDNMELLFYPAVEQAVGVERSRELFLEMAEIAWRRHSTMILREMAWDVLGYTASPILLQVQLTGEGYDSSSPRNYELLLYHTPVLSKYYMDYGSWWFCMAVILTILLQGCAAIEDRGRMKAGALWQIFFCLLTAGVLVVWYTMQGAGIMDYKNTIWIDELWLVWTLLLLREERGRELLSNSGAHCNGRIGKRRRE